MMTETQKKFLEAIEEHAENPYIVEPLQIALEHISFFDSEEEWEEYIKESGFWTRFEWRAYGKLPADIMAGKAPAMHLLTEEELIDFYVERDTFHPDDARKLWDVHANVPSALGQHLGPLFYGAPGASWKSNHFHKFLGADLFKMGLFRQEIVGMTLRTIRTPKGDAFVKAVEMAKEAGQF